LIVEIKTSEKGGIAQTMKITEIIATTHPPAAYPQRLEFILFDFESAVYLKKLLPNYQVHYLNGDKTATEIQNAVLDCMDYHYKLLMQDQSIVFSFKKSGLNTNSWTVNELETARQLSNQGIDSLTTDVPEKFLKEKV